MIMKSRHEKHKEEKCRHEKMQISSEFLCMHGCVVTV